MPIRFINRSPGRRLAAWQIDTGRPAADAVAKEMNEFGRPTSAARQRRRYLGQLLGEGLPLASFETTLPALDTKLHGHARALRRQILQMALMPAMPVQ